MNANDKFWGFVDSEILMEDDPNQFIEDYLDDADLEVFDKDSILTIYEYGWAATGKKIKVNVFDWIRENRPDWLFFLLDAGDDKGKGITKANLLSQMKINIFSKSRSIEDDKSSADAGEKDGK